MDELFINHFAVWTAAFANMVVGALWYSPVLFFERWKAAAGVTDAMIEKANMGKTYGLSFLMALIIAYNLAAFLGDAATDAAWGATAGFLAGFGFAGAMATAIALFEQRSATYILVSGGYIVVCFTVMGFIIGVWR
jgi:hypothetical protein